MILVLSYLLVATDYLLVCVSGVDGSINRAYRAFKTLYRALLVQSNRNALLVLAIA